MASNVWKSAALAKTYLDGVRGALPLAETQIEVMLRLLAACDGPIGTFLDLGCGNGILGAAILKRHRAAQGVFLDYSDAMIDAAQTNLRAYGDRARFIVGDFGEPNWIEAARPHGPYDAIVSGFAIHHQPDARKRDLYREIYELLRPGGLFVHIEHVSSPTPWVEERFAELVIDGLYAAHRERGSSASRDEVAQRFYYRPDKQANILAPVEAQCDWLRAVGFQDVDCYLKLFEIAVFGGRRG